MGKKIKAINLLGGKCSKCGNSDIFCLDFHHNSNKLNIIAKLKHYRWSILKKEISKCILLCVNCHKETHCVSSRHNDEKAKIFLDNKFTKCHRCGYRGENLASLDFHHFGKKNFIVSDIINRNKKVSLDVFMEEINNCEIICANCHRQEHINVDKFNELKKIIYEKVITLKEQRTPLSRSEVFKMYKDGMRQIDIAKHFDCSRSTISMIINPCQKSI